MTGLLQKLRSTLVKDGVRLPFGSTPSPLRAPNRDRDMLVERKPQELAEAPRESNSGRNTPPHKHGWLRTVLVTSMGATALILGAWELKMLQSWELKAYDQMLRLRPREAPDPRILLVTVTEEDKDKYNVLSDSIINQLLAKLQSYQPRVIGLSIYRSAQTNLAASLSRKDNIITACAFSSVKTSEIAPPPNFSIYNVGFTDLVVDEDGIVRRSLLFADSKKDKKCTTPFSFAMLMAMSYLEKEGIEADYSNQQSPKFFHPKNPNLKANFKILNSNAGSYKRIDAGGYQIMLNYRHPDSLAREVSLTQVLNGEVNPNLVKDRLVIIGTKTPSLHPGFYTPYNALPNQPARMSPVWIHAQIASQIISAVLDGRPLIWYLPEWAEIVWIWVWAFTGAALAWQLRYPLLLVMVGGTSISGLVGICAAVFLQAGWIPMVPPALALVFSGIGVMAFTTYRTQQETKIILLQVEKQQEAIEQLSILLKESTEIKDKHLHDSPKVDTLEKSTGDTILSGRYRVNRVLASGGFGCAYLAQDTHRPGSPFCVVKQLMPARRDTRFLQVARRLFDAEAEILETLGQHRQIPQLLAYFEENHEFYLVQEYIQGHQLSEELPPIQRVQDELFVSEMLKGILEILAFVHEHRVIHRDIKPTNIIRRASDNQLVLIDFGAVKTMQLPTDEQTELATVAIGTRGYAPPEQFAGHPRLSSDIYAVGMIAIQAVTGLSPHDLQPNQDTGTVMWRHRAKVSEELVEILDKMVRYHFSDRYQSAADVLQDLNCVCTKIKLLDK
ncbi:MAG: CHASE2 domain-containing serine/threonine-protein kinase [Scytonema sp. PMC 1069.18]|nr:CHASE2 domain-containing serine/threonine-protein kinase [Scytonema sp. PMC 1069.18]MEC4883230.1 CHASE2 domain-containing serine/threonine-protein kinase [Scytonema sp. PMC 1070.18]